MMLGKMGGCSSKSSTRRSGSSLSTTIVLLACWSLLLLLFDAGIGADAFQPSRPTAAKRHQLSTRRYQSNSLSTKSSSSSENKKQPPSSILPSKYPTLRGSEVDSRKIIATGAGRQHLTAVRVSHILFATDDLAQASLHELQKGVISFEELAKQISLCPHTREKGGSVGWISIGEHFKGSSSTENDNTKGSSIEAVDVEADTINEHLDEIFPARARIQTVHISTKPGDIIPVESELGYHLVHIVDVMADVRKMAYTKMRKRKITSNASITINKPITERGILSGALSSSDRKDLTYKIETMGCQMNLADSERIEGQLQSLGIRPIQSENDGTEDDKQQKIKPDVVVLNTCSIREHAESKVYSYLGPYAKRKRDGDDVAIVVAGCVAQQEGEKLLRRVPEVDLVMGPQYANRIADLLEDVSNGNQVVATEASHIMEDSSKPRRQSKTVAWVNVIYGCNERCAFCIVPTTRGVEQSRPLESIVREVEELVGEGFKEITLLGQNIDAYGRDMIPKRKFSDLLRIIGKVPGLERLRFVTSHPRYMSLGVVDAVAETDAACESFHIPFQSGSNEILASMGRGHTREKYLHIIDRIRSRLPDASISADVIVGFPGETEAQFEETLSLMREVKFDTVNTAAYSPRPNTPAAGWDNQVPDDVKQARLQKINVLVKEHARARRERMIGRVVEVLVEERNVRVPTQVMGRTRHGYITYFKGDIDELRGKLVNVHIHSCQSFHLVGEISDGTNISTKVTN